MSNGPAWLIAATATFFAGGVLVPLDVKLEPPEQRALLQHAQPRVLITEYAVWRSLALHGLPLTTWVAEGPRRRASDPAPLGDAAAIGA